MSDKLAFLEGLSPEQALRYKLFTSTPISPEAIKDVSRIGSDTPLVAL
jgi:hypothetical protein